MKREEIVDLRYRLKSDSALRWFQNNPILLDGEPGLEPQEDGSTKLKIGDGETAWNDLPYFAGGPIEPGEPTDDAALLAHIHDPTPHPIYDDGPSLTILYENAKV